MNKKADNWKGMYNLCIAAKIPEHRSCVIHWKAKSLGIDPIQFTHGNLFYLLNKMELNEDETEKILKTLDLHGQFSYESLQTQIVLNQILKRFDRFNREMDQIHVRYGYLFDKHDENSSECTNFTLEEAEGSESQPL
jgi:hypothetical protein